jgi:hypothetical protein
VLVLTRLILGLLEWGWLRSWTDWPSRSCGGSSNNVQVLEGYGQVHRGVERSRFQHLHLRLHGLPQIIGEYIPLLGVGDWLDP